ncbi:tetraspanin [Mycena amicta]|nr:tetraspanin [Mycena amicta]
MVSKGLMGVWALFDILLLGAGGMSIALSILWRKPDILMNLAIDNEFLTAGMVLGIALCATFLVSLGAVVQRNHITVGFVILNWMLVLDSIMVVVVGSMIWFFSLQQRSEFHLRWIALPQNDKITLQDEFKCCGYFNATDNPVFGGNFCVSQDFANSLATNVTTNFCVTPITLHTDYTLENTFTTIYGYMSVVIGLLVCSLCVIKKRQEEERFKKIDAKRGGGGFV